MRKPILFARGALVAIPLLLASPPATAQFADGLVAYWPLDGNTDDATATGADGTLVPGTGVDQTERYAAAKFGDGIDLNNFTAQAFDQYIEITGVPESTFDFTGGSMSISMWAATPFLSFDNQTLAAKGLGNSWSLQRDGANLSLAMLGGGRSAADDPLADLFADLALHHIVAVVEAGVGITLYLDGQVAGTVTGDIQIGDSASNLAFGANPADLRPWEGVIDDVAIWDRVLTSSEVTTIYNGGTGVSIGDLLNPVDSDSDGMPDYYENSNGLDPAVNDADADLDGDGRTNFEEFQDGTNPNNNDTDGDGLTDGEEEAAGTNPTSADTDGDKIDDGDEINGSLNPWLDGTLRDPFDPLTDPPGDPTDPIVADSDGDEFDDLSEIKAGSNPNDSNDSPSPWQIGLLGYWPLDQASFEATDTDPAARYFPDVSGQDHNAVWDGSSTTPAWFTGKFSSRVARLNAPTGGGAQFLTVQNSESDLSGADGDISISTWFKSVGYTKDWQALVAKGEGNSWRVHRWATSSPGVLSYAGGTAEVPSTNIGPRVDDFKWHHVVAITEHGVESRIFVDGQLIETSALPPSLADNGIPVQIGGNPEAAGREHVGMIEEVAIWGRPLTDGEVAQLYLNGAGATVADLIVGADDDNDGLPNTFETAYGLDPNDGTGDNGPDGDPDEDGLSNLEEEAISSNPNDSDSDGDGLDDGEEATLGTHPLRADTDRDGLTDAEEVNGSPATNPLLADTDGDGVDDRIEIIVGRDPTVPDTAGPSNNYVQNFDAYPDGFQELSDRSVIGSSNGTSAAVIGQRLRLTEDGVGSTFGTFRIPALIGSSQGFTASFDFTLVDGVGNNVPADGFSFSYGAIPATGNGNAEEGWGPGVEHLSFEVDTWNNGGGEAGIGIASFIGGTESQVIRTAGLPFGDGGTVNGSATLSWDPSNGVSLATTGVGGALNVNFENVPVPNFVGDEDYIFAFTARTGGANEDLFIDNIIIQTTAVAPPRLEVGSSGDDLVLTWDSKDDRVYDIVSSLDLTGDPGSWPVIEANIQANPPENVKTIARPGDPKRFYAIVEKR